MKKIFKLVIGIFGISTIAGIDAFIVECKKGLNKSRHKPYGIYEKYLKRPLDVFFATGALMVLSPVIGIMALLVRLKLGSPVLFKQERLGLDGKIFTIRKFRTMTNQKDADGELLPDENRLTSFGKMLRSTSLDELPELVNIIKGDMSIVGPRPLLVRYLERYTPIQRRRQEVRPGLTGLATSTIRNSAGWEKKFVLDVEYVDKVSFLLDFQIIMWTIVIVLKRKGINEEGNATNSEFMGIEGDKR